MDLASVHKEAGLKTSSRVRKDNSYPAWLIYAVVPWLTLLQLVFQMFITFVQLSVRKMRDLEKWPPGLHVVEVSGVNCTVAKSIPFTQYFHLHLYASSLYSGAYLNGLCSFPLRNRFSKSSSVLLASPTFLISIWLFWNVLQGCDHLAKLIRRTCSFHYFLQPLLLVTCTNSTDQNLKALYRSPINW